MCVSVRTIPRMFEGGAETTDKTEADRLTRKVD